MLLNNYYVYPFRTDPLPRFDLDGPRGFFPPLQRLRNQTFPITPPQTPPRIPTPIGTLTSSRSSSPIDLSLFPPPPGTYFH
jgi:hypothetical protein